MKTDNIMIEESEYIFKCKNIEEIPSDAISDIRKYAEDDLNYNDATINVYLSNFQNLIEHFIVYEGEENDYNHNYGIVHIYSIECYNWKFTVKGIQCKKDGGGVTILCEEIYDEFIEVSNIKQIKDKEKERK